MSHFSPKTKTFLLKPGSRVDKELQAFLATIRPDGLRAATAAESHGQVALNLIYETSHPQVIGTSPVHGARNVPTALDQVIILFDEELDASVNTKTAPEVCLIWENGTDVTSSATLTRTNGGYGINLTGVFTTNGAVYQILLRKDIPFTSGRLSGQQNILSFGVSGAGAPGYAEIYINNGATAQTVSAATDERVVWNITGGANGLSSGVTPDYANNRIAIDQAGVYEIEFTLSFTGVAAVAIVWHFHAYDGDPEGTGTEIGNVGVHHHTSTDDVASVSAAGLYTFAVGDHVYLGVSQDTGSDRAFTIIEGNLKLRLMG